MKKENRTPQNSWYSLKSKSTIQASWYKLFVKDKGVPIEVVIKCLDEFGENHK
jgi:hypothetical protein